jgi:hypothetical protein
MRRGKITAEMWGDTATQEEIMNKAILGVKSSDKTELREY